MEVNCIDKMRTVQKVVKKEAVQAAHIEDRLTISQEAQKKAEWVETLKNMPDIRADKIEGLNALDPLFHPEVLSAIAEKIQTTITG